MSILVLTNDGGIQKLLMQLKAWVFPHLHFTVHKGIHKAVLAEHQRKESGKIQGFLFSFINCGLDFGLNMPKQDIITGFNEEG